MPSSPLADLPVFNQIDINQIATDTQFVQRQSKKFCPSCFIQSLLDAIITGEASQSSIANSMSNLVGKSISKQAIGKRFSDTSSNFLFQVLESIIDQEFLRQAERLNNSFFNRVLVEDSSRKQIHSGNAKMFPGYGNHVGDTAEFKINLAYDLFTGDLVSNTYHEATEQDRSIGIELLNVIRERDLVLRDMGYFTIKQLADIESVGAYWVSRLPVNTKVRVIDSESEIPLEKALTKVGRNTKKVDLKIKLGKVGYECRLVAVRADKHIIKQRSEKRKRHYTEAHQKVGAIRDRWHILITNIEPEISTIDDLIKVYRMRWDIEIQFRAWKQSLGLKDAFNRSSSPHHIYALIVAAMIHLTLLVLARGACQKELKLGELSTEKLAKSLSQFILKAKRFERCWDFVADLRNIKKDSRKRAIPLAEGFKALSCRE